VDRLYLLRRLGMIFENQGGDRGRSYDGIKVFGDRHAFLEPEGPHNLGFANRDRL
jgi:hypothetical protein